jgi:hypothetical protein
VPAADEDGKSIATRIARNPGGFDFPPTTPRSPFGRHVFAGGNTLVPAILRSHAEAAGAAGRAAAFTRAIELTRRQLRSETARLEIGEVMEEEGALTIPVRITNLAGHKLPTGYPSRRLWLRALLSDANGAVLFACGDFDGTGRILGADRKPLATERAGGEHAPHRTVITSADDVQAYESLLEDSDGEPTYTLLRAARYRKDNRLLPAGWSAEAANAAGIAPVGTERDSDFGGGSDTVVFRVEAGDAPRPLTFRASLHFQALSPRYAAEIFRWRTPETEAFRAFYEAADRVPELVDEAVRQIPPRVERAAR